MNMSDEKKAALRVDIDPQLMKRLKMYGAKYGHKIKDMVSDAIEIYLEDDGQEAE